MRCDSHYRVGLVLLVTVAAASCVVLNSGPYFVLPAEIDLALTSSYLIRCKPAFPSQ